MQISLRAGFETAEGVGGQGTQHIGGEWEGIIARTGTAMLPFVVYANAAVATGVYLHACAHVSSDFFSSVTQTSFIWRLHYCRTSPFEPPLPLSNILLWWGRGAGRGYDNSTL